MIRKALDMENRALELGQGSGGGFCLWSPAAALSAAGSHGSPPHTWQCLGSQGWLILMAAWRGKGQLLYCQVHFLVGLVILDSCQLGAPTLPLDSDSCKRETGGRIFTAWGTLA